MLIEIVIENEFCPFSCTANLHYEKFSDGTEKFVENEIHFEIPSSWMFCRLGDLFTVCSSKRVLQSEWKDSGIPFYRAREIVKLSDNDSVDNELFISEDHYQKLAKEYGVPLSGDLMVSAVGTIGKTYIVKDTDKFYYKDASVLCFQNRTGCINSSYAKYLLESTFMQSQMHNFSKGSTVDTITISTAMRYLCILPPVKEQERIVATINNLLSLNDCIDYELNNLKALVTNAKSKILDLAIRGKLVPQDPNDEPASILLEHIRKEKEELIKSGKLKRDKRESVIFRGDDNSYYLRTGKLVEPLTDWSFDDLPKNWEICCFGEICNYGDCINTESSVIENSAWILDLEDIEKDTGRIVSRVSKADRPSISTKHKFHKGQVLYSKLRPYLNKVVLADRDGYCTSEILPLEFHAEIIPEYARYYLMSPTFLRYADKCSYGVKMPRLGTNDGKKAIFPLPPINEQRRIVKQIELMFSHLSGIEISVQ